ncbi:uncharacterized protein LOC127263117 [Andrographis paniculata]|uniref:uncharacterized protein LOC127263117 n=1 Tax=Andrographis paniculata TaxID=175694 RepID=UPI0021E8850B|nr:uncharacterized protein LOC127263117 [Andrographis paniculata]
MTAAASDGWVRAAMADDTLVVKLLVKLGGPPPKEGEVNPLEWTVRQRRSRSIPVNDKERKPSPTTPLSWGGAAASEESSRRPSFITTRSKTSIAIESDKASKRSRKKKTLAQLKSEEHTLFKERRNLKREISSARASLERHRAVNESLKRIKVDLQTHTPESTNCRAIPPKKLPEVSSTSFDRTFFLPDLNIPFDEPNPDTILGVS